MKKHSSIFRGLSKAAAVAFALGLCVCASSCGGGGGDSPGANKTPASLGTGASPAAASLVPDVGAQPAAQTPAAEPANVAASTLLTKTVTLEVPQLMQTSPLDIARQLNVPEGFGVRVLARVLAARFMLVTRNGDILVSQPSTGKIILVRSDVSGNVVTSDFATGLDQGHDMVLATIDNQQWLYVSEASRVTRSLYVAGESTIGAMQPVVVNLPDASLPELQGAYGHVLKNIAVSPSGALYVSVASSCNACESDATATPVRGAIYRYDADGGNGRLFARGIRNAEGLDFVPGTERLWMTVNNRDQIAYPYDNDYDGDGASDYGKIMPGYVDDQPPEPFAEVIDGANYGWPYCNPVASESMSDLSFVNDYDLNRDGTQLDCTKAGPIAHGFHAHTAPLGLSFLKSSNLPASINGGAAVAMHGCWNCTRPFGYKVVLVRFDDQLKPTSEVDLLTGFTDDMARAAAWGRPVDVVAHTGRGSLLVSDDLAGAIYEIYPNP